MCNAADRIVIVNPSGDLEVASADGAHRRTIAAGDRYFHFPAWSPDGCRIASIGGNRDRTGIYIFDGADDAPGNVDEPDAGQIAYETAHNAPIYLYWSPDGAHLSFLAALNESRTLGLHVVSTNAGAMKEGVRPTLVASGRPCFWEWSPDSRRILMHVGGWEGDEAARLVLLDPFDRDARKSATAGVIKRPGSFQAPGFARDGRRRAFGQLSRKNELHLVIDGLESQRGEAPLVIPHAGVAALTWSPARDQLAFISPPEPVRTYYGPLRLLDAATGDVRVLAHDVVLAFFWSPDGRSILYFTVADAVDHLRDLLTDPARTAMDGGTFRLDVDASQAGVDDADEGERMELWLNAWIVNVDDGDPELLCTFEPVDLFVNQFLPFFDQYAKSHRIWSPGSDAIALPMMMIDADNVQREPMICAVSVARKNFGAITPVAPGIAGFWRPLR